ncbi:MAG: mechanosensitive ion channel family protein [Candidatus Zixiibacteriota bacterium]|nr:MAG: mechanosensitive ion channel family protein [candidate division Zixibacteria bacterium]
MDLDYFFQYARNWLVSSGLRIIIIVVISLAALKLAGILSTRIFVALKRTGLDNEMRKRTDTLGSLIRYILSVAVIATGIFMILGELGINIGPILAAAGIVGLAIGFGAQQLVQDVISGFFILLEDQIRVGDVINVADRGGLVEKVTLRTTVLRDLAGSVHYVRNGQIGIVTNMTKGYSFFLADIGVAYREDVDEVIEVIKEVDSELRKKPEFAGDILEPIEVLGLDQFADSAVVIRARIKTKPIKQWQVGREFNRLLKKRFDEKNIEIPFPHVTLYMGEGKDSTAPPVRVSRIDGEKRR